MNEQEQKVLLQIVEELVKGQEKERPNFARASLQAIATIKKNIRLRGEFEKTH